ncbi:DUF2199 domain-containing protein [Kitasatospora sp. NBC_01539]|uniref:DUF2199 domain-containing protein n=1 Tax=Kitasatospora sp. NBC_01539 TaxID=2903577 RepID=UPI0038601727
MPTETGFTCTCCGEYHPETPMDFASPAPAYWLPGEERHPASLLTDDQCVIKGESFFVRARVEIPVVGRDTVFTWGVWVSLSDRNYARAGELWETAGRESEPPAFGWLSTELPVYAPSTVNLRTMVHTRPVGERPVVEIEPTDHPLAVEQRNGITMERVREIAGALLHPQG